FVPYITEARCELDENGEYIIKLKPDMKWHNGQAVTAENVVQSYKILKHQATAYSMKSILDMFISVEKIDNLTVKFIPNPANPGNDKSMVFPILPTEVIQSVFLQQNCEFTLRNPVGNGPFMLREKQNNRLIFKRFDDFVFTTANGIHTNIDVVECKQNVNMGSWPNDLIQGHVDVLTSVPQWEMQSLSNITGVRLLQYDNYSIEFFAFNMNHVLLKEKFIRLAMYYGVNREEWVNGFLSGRADIATGPYPAGSYYDWQDIPTRKFDREKAINILQEAGCVRGNDGIFTFNGKRLSFRILHKADEMLANLGLVTTFTQNMREIGIEIQDPEAKDSYSFVENLIQKDYEIAFTKIVLDEALSIRNIYHSKGSSNFLNIKNSTVDKLFDQLEQTEDPKMMQMIGNQIHQEIHDNPPALFLWTRQRYAAYNRNKISRFDVHPIYFFMLINEWIYND
ncbi:ABC transporter substrate-binding protein, partial [bacterium]|nr:ABC transporter substrate-binding protein [bacterium]